MFMEVLLPIAINIRISLGIDRPIVGADPRGIVDAMQIVPLVTFDREQPVEQASGVLFAPIFPIIKQSAQQLPDQGFNMGFSILEDQSVHTFRMYDSQPEVYRCTDI